MHVTNEESVQYNEFLVTRSCQTPKRNLDEKYLSIFFLKFSLNLYFSLYHGIDKGDQQEGALSYG